MCESSNHNFYTGITIYSHTPQPNPQPLFTTLTPTHNEYVYVYIPQNSIAELI